MYVDRCGGIQFARWPYPNQDWEVNHIWIKAMELMVRTMDDFTVKTTDKKTGCSSSTILSTGSWGEEHFEIVGSSDLTSTEMHKFDMAMHTMLQDNAGKWSKSQGALAKKLYEKYPDW